jgi:hypothetical protein
MKEKVVQQGLPRAWESEDVLGRDERCGIGRSLEMKQNLGRRDRTRAGAGT